MFELFYTFVSRIILCFQMYFQCSLWKTAIQIFSVFLQLPSLIWKLYLLPEGLMLTEPATIILSCFQCGFPLTAQELMLFFSKHTVLLRGDLDVRAGSVFPTVPQHVCRTYLLTFPGCPGCRSWSCWDWRGRGDEPVGTREMKWMKNEWMKQKWFLKRINRTIQKTGCAVKHIIDIWWL